MDNISKPETDGWIGKYKSNTFENYQQAEYDKATSFCKNKRTAIDLGGNIGMMAYRMCKDFNEVHSFEPLFSQHILRNTLQFDNITVYPFAVGDKKEKVIMRKGIYHSGGSNIVKEKESNHQTYVDDVEVVILDDYNFKNVDFLKIDVEHYEYQALLGSIKTIEKYSPVILIEIHNDNIDREKIFSLLNDLKYNGIQAGGEGLDWIYTK
jgi:FkbM family methyltransferase